MSTADVPHTFRRIWVRLGLSEQEGAKVITLGVVCLIIGLIFGIPLIWTIGVILVVVGIVLVLLGMMGRAIGPRSHYY
jgi:uncharacterized membrane protein HdeD (DUF308 family)